jgi:hypothetical protein
LTGRSKVTLDKVNEAGKVLYSDGFSRNPRKQAIVPDFLFFGAEAEYDLNAIFGTKNKHYQVKGLIDILACYKFTVTENTPIEEEVALDPELLGKVFENLLASYNPETQTTARKQTGSFYTPREIVNYMVDESLKAYLKQALADKFNIQAEDAAAGLEILFSYTEREHAFTQEETKVLIQAIDACKILDPACGSGAFPMGILHKFVHILHKLDPNNEKWREIQRQKAIKETEEAYKIGDQQQREERLLEISDIFENNSDDYGRKLYLIENCIYGVDIQPIAVQIAKLRFFISLVVDQNKQPGKDNLGIRSLPNLETKFVAANTLIGLEKSASTVKGKVGMGFLRNPDIEQKENELKQLRHQYFNAKTRREKLEYQRQDKSLRRQIANLLINEGWNNTTAEQIVQFDPYDQNASSPFFAPEWMFGIKGGFDVVIGNPPYVQIQNFSGMPQQKDWEKQEYETYVKTGDVYCLFYEQGFRLLKDSGILTFITSNKWMRAKYGSGLRKFFSDKTRPQILIDFGGFQVFESATVDTSIMIFLKGGDKSHSIKACTIRKDFTEATIINEYLTTHGIIIKELTEQSWVISSNEEYIIKKRIEEIGIPLKDWDIAIYRGILTGLNEAFIIDSKKKNELIAKTPKSAEIIKPILRGRDIKKHKAEFADIWLINAHNGYTDKNGHKVPRINVKQDYPAIWDHLNKINEKTNGRAEKRYDQGEHWTNLSDCTYLGEFEKEKIIYPDIMRLSQNATSFEGYPYFYLDKHGYYPEATNFLMTGNGIVLIISVLSSKLGAYAFTKFYAGPQFDERGFRYKKEYLQNFPVPQISHEAQLPFKIIIDSILFAKEHNLNPESSTLEWVLDVMVFGLYFEPEMKKNHCHINNRVAEVIKPFTSDDTDAFKAEYIKTFVKFCDQDDIIRHGLVHSHLIESVQIILGDKK